MAEKVPLGELPGPSTAMTSDPVFEADGGAATLQLEFDRDGMIYRSGVRFERPRAYRVRAEGHCSEWHIDGVYDTIAELKESDWVAELIADTPAESWALWEMRHFMIYIDSAGCFEVVGSAWSLLPEERVR